jgi:hypothetical protein
MTALSSRRRPRNPYGEDGFTRAALCCPALFIVADEQAMAQMIEAGQW